MVSINKFGGTKDSRNYDADDDCGNSVLYLSSTDPDTYDAESKRIVNLGKPKESDDATTFSYLENRLMDINKDIQHYVSKYYLEKSVFNEDIENITERFVTSKKDMEDCLDKIVVHQKSINDLLESLNKCENRIDTLEPTVSSTKRTVAIMKRVVDENRQEINMFNAKLSSINSSISNSFFNEFQKFLQQLRVHDDELKDIQRQIDNNIEGDITRNNEIFNRFQGLEDASSRFTLNFLNHESRLATLEENINNISAAHAL